MTKRYKLNSKQIDLLKAIHRFRFVNSDLLAKYKNLSRASINYSLSVLLDQGLINRIYDKEDKLNGKHAIYYLEPKAYRDLKKYYEVDLDSSNAYKNKTVSRLYIQNQLNIMGTYLNLREKYGDSLTFLTYVETKSLEYIPKRLLDAIIKIKNKHTIDILLFNFIDEDTPRYLLNRKIKNYISYYDSREWEELSSNFPSLLFICNSKDLSSWLNMKIGKVFEEEGIMDINFKVSRRVF